MVSSLCRRFKINFAENTASIYRDFKWKKQTESSVKIVGIIVDDLVVFTPDVSEKVVL